MSKWTKIIKSKDSIWEKSWFLKYNLLLSTYSAEQYTKNLYKFIGRAIPSTIIVCRDQITTGYVIAKEAKNFSDFLTKKISRNPILIKAWIKELYKSRNEMVSLLKVLDKKILARTINKADYIKFTNAFFVYGNAHFVIKRVPEKNLDKKLFRLLVLARKKDENLYPRIDKFITAYMRFIALKTAYRPDHLLCLTNKELEKYLSDGCLPPKKDLAARRRASALIVKSGAYKVVAGEKSVQDIEKEILPVKNKKIFVGTTAYPGIVRGVARVVMNSKNPGKFKMGDILIAPMTRIDYIELMKKSSAIVTDIGGALSHAAIVSRELHIPCVTGTKVATKICKDGDRVEVNASAGTVKIIN